MRQAERQFGTRRRRPTDRFSPRLRRGGGPSLRGEAVEEPGAARPLECVLAAAAGLPARGVRRVPGLRGVVVAQALAVVMAHHGGAGGAARPVLAGAVLAGREGGAVGLRAGEDVVGVGLIATAVHGLALLGQGGLLGELVPGAVEVGHAGGHHLTLGVLPWSVSDTVLGVDGRLGT